MARVTITIEDIHMNDGSSQIKTSTKIQNAPPPIILDGETKPNLSDAMKLGAMALTYMQTLVEGDNTEQADKPQILTK